jgi:hypothetical protein
MKSNLRQSPTGADQAFLSDLGAPACARERGHHEGCGHAQLSRSRPQGDRRTTQYRARDGDRLRAAQKHADQIAERIVQLGEDPDLNPATLLSRAAFGI